MTAGLAHHDVMMFAILMRAQRAEDLVAWL